MKRYWKAKLGEVNVSEKEKSEWSSEVDYSEVSLNLDDIQDEKGNPLKISIQKNDKIKSLFQGKSANGSFNKIDITHRFLGFKLGNNTVKIIISESKPEIRVSIE